MSVTVTITITGGERVDRVLGALGEVSAAPFRVVGEEIMAGLERHVAQTFRTEGGAAGLPWPPLAPRTVRARLKRWGYYRLAPGAGAGPMGPILEWTGDLARSFQRGQLHHVEELRDTALVWGSDDLRAVYVAARRPMLVLGTEAVREEIILGPIRTALLRAMRS